MTTTDRARLRPDPSKVETRPLWQRLAWFVLLWLGGVAAVSVLAYAIKLGMGLG